MARIDYNEILRCVLENNNVPSNKYSLDDSEKPMCIQIKGKEITFYEPGGDGGLRQVDRYYNVISAVAENKSQEIKMKDDFVKAILRELHQR
jgi:hypothetical protein